MKPEKLLDALNDIDSDLIAGAHAPQTRSRPRFTLLIAAVLVTAALTATAFASETISGWFKQYFERQNDVPLSSEQVQYLEENEQIIEASQEVNGYNLELKSVLADSNMFYVTIGITAPTGMDLQNMNLWFYDSLEIFDQQKQPIFSFSRSIEDDLDDLTNTANLVLKCEPGDWNSGSHWTIRIKSLHQEIYDEAYEQELRRTKYAGQTDIMFTPEESDRIYQYPIIAEGPWTFTFDLNDASNQGIEMISEPLFVTAIVSRWTSDNHLTCDIVDGIESIQLNSFVLTPLGGTLQFEENDSICGISIEWQNHARYGNHDMYVVMKDGSNIALHRGSTGTSLEAESPIVLTEVDHILLPDGTKIMAP